MKVVLDHMDSWRVVSAGLFVLGYSSDVLDKGVSVKVTGDKELQITINDTKIIPKPEKYKEKTGVDLVNGYATGQWKEGEING